jgi:hypothetical protein
MATMTGEPIKSLYKRLREVGFTKNYVKNYGFPDWWEDEQADDEDIFYEAKLTLTRRLGLDLRSVLDPSQPLEFRSFGPCRFKAKQGDKPFQAISVQSITRIMAEIAVAGLAKPYSPLPSKGSSIREEILAEGHPWVSFESLLGYLWKRGIPVLFLAQSPGSPKMDGMVTMVKGRPVIVLARNRQYGSWQLFILAHEIGHIVLGHVNDNETLFDEEILASTENPQEKEANICGLEIITGDGGTEFKVDSWLSTNQLAHIAIQYGKQHQVDPGHVALNYGKVNGQMPAAQGALSIIERASARSQDVIYRHLVENIDPDRLPEDSYSFLMSLCRSKKSEK